MKEHTAVDKFALVTDKLISLIEQGVKPWAKEWHSHSYQNLVTHHEYSGINPLLCQIDSLVYGYQKPYFVGFNQAKQNNWQVKKGSKSTWIMYAASGCKETELDNGEVEKKFWKTFKWINVFNVACIDDSASKKKIDDFLPNEQVNTEPRIDAIESTISKNNPKIEYGSDRAFYTPSTDEITLPAYGQFHSAIAYYATLLHELCHWTGHESRCNRKISNRFGNADYAFEELIAELGSAMLCSEFNIDSQLDNHASYLSNWLDILKQDKKAFFKASSLAISAVNFILQ